MNYSIGNSKEILPRLGLPSKTNSSSLLRPTYRASPPLGRGSAFGVLLSNGSFVAFAQVAKVMGRHNAVLVFVFTAQSTSLKVAAKLGDRYLSKGDALFLRLPLQITSRTSFWLVDVWRRSPGSPPLEAHSSAWTGFWVIHQSRRGCRLWCSFSGCFPHWRRVFPQCARFAVFGPQSCVNGFGDVWWYHDESLQNGGPSTRRRDWVGTWAWHLCRWWPSVTMVICSCVDPGGPWLWSRSASSFFQLVIGLMRPQANKRPAQHPPLYPLLATWLWFFLAHLQFCVHNQERRPGHVIGVDRLLHDRCSRRGGLCLGHRLGKVQDWGGGCLGKSLWLGNPQIMIGHCPQTVFLVWKVEVYGWTTTRLWRDSVAEVECEDGVWNVAHPTPTPLARSAHLFLCVSQPAHLFSLFSDWSCAQDHSSNVWLHMLAQDLSFAKHVTIHISINVTTHSHSRLDVNRKDFSNYEELGLMMAADLKWSYDIAYLIYEINERRAVTRRKGEKLVHRAGRLKNVPQRKTIGSCSRSDACSSLQAHASGDREDNVEWSGDTQEILT